MAALTRSAVRLLGQHRGNARATTLFNSARTCYKASLSEPQSDLVKNSEMAAMMKNRRLREDRIGRSSMEAFMQARMGVKRLLTDEELSLIGGDPNLLAPDSDMMEEFVDTVRGDMDTYDQGCVDMNEDAAKIIGSGKYNDPILIPSASETRYVICYCPEYDGDAVTMLLHMGERRPCQCGNWYQLVDF